MVLERFSNIIIKSQSLIFKITDFHVGKVPEDLIQSHDLTVVLQRRSDVSKIT